MLKVPYNSRNILLGDSLIRFMKFGDKEIYGSTEGIKANLREVILQLNDKVSHLHENEELDFVIISLRSLTNYTSILLERLTLYQQSPIEFCAISARNLFECYLLVAFILSDPSKAKEFVGQKASEELEINEGFLSLTEPSTPEAVIKSIQDRMTYIKELMNKHEVPIEKHWTVSYLAKQTNNKVEYESFFKLYSKYIHPSSWIVNSLANEYDNPVFRNIFVLQGQHYASCIQKLVSNYLRDQIIA
ncbi:DUF5677 domain-containing protein [Niastella vici]|nr:DUF5677 domain-containing protein [Niastella vici]